MSTGLLVARGVGSYGFACEEALARGSRGHPGCCHDGPSAQISTFVLHKDVPKSVPLDRAVRYDRCSEVWFARDQTPIVAVTAVTYAQVSTFVLREDIPKSVLGSAVWRRTKGGQ